jgi:hypothetical protein
MLLLVALVLAAPRLDGFYVPEASRGLVDGPATGPDELRVLQTVTFTETKVTVHFVLEDEVLEWHPYRAGLAVKPEHAGWRQRTWVENADGSVESNLLSGRLRFVPGSMKARLAAAEQRFTRLQLQRLKGTWADTLTLDPAGLRRDGGVSPLKAITCNPGCDANFPSVCLQADDLVLLETSTGLLRLPRTALGLCTGFVTGVDPTNGVPLAPRVPAKKPTSRTDPAQVIAALDARARMLARCNPNTVPLPLKLTLSIGDSGLVSSLDAALATTCLAEPLSKLVFDGPAEKLTLRWTLPPL